MSTGLSHTAKYAVGVAHILPTQHGTYLKARGAIYKPERSSKDSQIFWAPPIRQWLKVYAIERGAKLVVEHHPTCPCAMT